MIFDHCKAYSPVSNTGRCENWDMYMEVWECVDVIPTRKGQFLIFDSCYNLDTRKIFGDKPSGTFCMNHSKLWSSRNRSMTLLFLWTYRLKREVLYAFWWPTEHCGMQSFQARLRHSNFSRQIGQIHLIITLWGGRGLLLFRGLISCKRGKRVKYCDIFA